VNKLNVAILVIVMSAGLCLAAESEATSFWDSDSPTNGFWGLNDSLADSGIEFGASLLHVYQVNTKGGTSTHSRKGRHVGRYDLEMAFDLEHIAGIKNGSFFVHGWSGWTDAGGIDDSSVGAAYGLNAVAVGNRSIDVVEAFYEGTFFSDDIGITAGKVDFTGIFDASEYADDEGAQFLNGGLVDNPTIPFTEQGLGVILNWDITESWYLMGGVVDAQGNGTETGFRTTFHKEDYFLYMLETGKGIELNSANGAMPGSYRFGVWFDGQNKDSINGNEQSHSDHGFYTSCDQVLYKENSDADDTQGLGAFFRFGWANSAYNETTNFYSGGFQYQGLFDGRDDDVLGVGYAEGSFSDQASADYLGGYERMFETYYNVQLTPWFTFGPSMQYIVNPGGTDNVQDAVVIALRGALTF
jgi:porin